MHWLPGEPINVVAWRRVPLASVETRATRPSCRDRILALLHEKPHERFQVLAESDRRKLQDGVEHFTGWRHPRIHRPDGPRYDDSFYEAVAKVYLWHVKRRLPPAPVLAEANDVELTTAHRWIKEARRRGLLPPGTRGKGRMTDIKLNRERKTWEFVVDLPSADGKRRQAHRRGFATKKAAREALDGLRGRVAAGLHVDPKTVTVGTYLVETWIPSLPLSVRPTTADTYTRLVRSHVLPHLGCVRLQRLDRAQVRVWVDKLAESGLSPKSVRNVHGVLSKALADAIELRLIVQNPASRARLPKVKRRPPRAWTTEQLSAFLAQVEGTREASLWRLVAMTGCRRGELLGLRWPDLDLDGATMTITRQRTIAGGKVVEGAPKSDAGARTVALDAATVASLRAWRRTQNAERLRMGAGWAGGDLVFTRSDGVGLWPQSVTATFRRLAGELGLPQIGLHGLRHTAATFMIGTGVSPKLVQQRLGHAHVSVTLGLYSHVMPGHDRDAAEALAAAVGRE